MDGAGHSRTKEALEKQNICSDNFKDDKAYTRSAKAKGSCSWNSVRPSPLAHGAILAYSPVSFVAGVIYASEDARIDELLKKSAHAHKEFSDVRKFWKF